MKPIDYTCVRIRDTNEYKMDVEKFIKSIEDQFKINFKTLPQWKNLIEKLYFVSTYRDQKIHELNVRKFVIINKLRIENTRASPFELTDRLVRTAKVWQKSQWLNHQRHQHNTYDIEGPLPSIQTSSVDTDNATLSRLDETAEEDIILDDNRNNENEPNYNAQAAPGLTTQKEILSPMHTNYSDLSYHSLRSGDAGDIAESKPTVCHSLNFKLIECYPKEIVISNNSPEKQVINFFLKNISLDWVYVRFKNVTNCYLFKKANVFPYLTVKLFPGLSKVFKIVFNLMQTKEDFLTSIIFSVHYKNCNDSCLSEYCVNILTQFNKPKCIKVSEVVYIPPVNAWHLNPKSRYPRGILTLEVKDENEYYIRIIKDKKDLTEIESCNSNNATVQSTTDDSIKDMSRSSLQKSLTINQADNNNIDNHILSLIKDVIEIALDTFVFDLTCLRLPPNSKQRISVYLGKSEYVGYHQSYYDVEFRNVDTDELIETKTTKVFAEILPHPIEIIPTIFDMSDSPIIHGVCIDHFVIINTHKVFSTKIKIEASNITKELISIRPMTVFLHPKTSVKIEIRTCPSKHTFDNELKMMVHFTVKIIATGVKSVYDNIPPIYYEIIAPCASQFCEMYNLDTI